MYILIHYRMAIILPQCLNPLSARMDRAQKDELQRRRATVVSNDYDGDQSHITNVLLTCAIKHDILVHSQ